MKVLKRGEINEEKVRHRLLLEYEIMARLSEE